MNALLDAPDPCRGRAWGLVELYEMRLRRFAEDDVAVAQFLVSQAERRLETVARTRATRDDVPASTSCRRTPDSRPACRARGRRSAGRHPEAATSRCAMTTNSASSIVEDDTRSVSGVASISTSR